jgi:hypothetical protein
VILENTLIFISWDGVVHHIDMTNWSELTSFSSAIVSPSDMLEVEGVLFLTSWDGGVYRSEDLGQTWEDIGPNNSSFYKLVLQGDELFAAGETGLWTLSAPGFSSGCTDPLSCNFADDANLDDGSCHFNCLFCQDGTVWDEEVHGCISANTADINNDGCVQLSDLLDLLGAYGACAEAELAENPCGGGAFLSGDDIACTGWNYLGAYDGGEYYVSSIPVAWDSAQAFAVELNGGLAVISSQAENDWISNLVGDNYVWIGLYQDLNSTYYSEPDGGWGWVNGAPFVYENWASNSPNNVNNGTEHHCQMYSNGLWNDAPGDLFINGSDGRDIYAVIEFR